MTITSFNAFQRLASESCGRLMGSAIALSRLALFPEQPACDDSFDVRHSGAVLLNAAFSWATPADLWLRSVRLLSGGDMMVLRPEQACGVQLLHGWLGATAVSACSAPVVAGFDAERSRGIGPTFGDLTFVEADHPSHGREVEVIARASLSTSDGLVTVEASYGAEASSRPLSRTVRISGEALVRVGQGLRGQVPQENAAPDPDVMTMLLSTLPPVGGLH